MSNNYADIIKQSSFLVEPFADNTIVVNEGTNREYSKSISPLFDNSVINSGVTSTVMDIITSKVPYYHLTALAPNTSEDDVDFNKGILSQTRDSAINDVPSFLQSTFWECWFHDVIGNEVNGLLLNIYNRLQYPFINENQLLNLQLFPTLFDDIGLDEPTVGTINFDITSQEDGTSYSDVLDNIIDAKTQSLYSILDYAPQQSELISSWINSEYWSGKLTSSEAVFEEDLFKIQDIHSELLRRKFAGSSTLYKITLSSIDRQGNLVRTVPIGSSTLSSTSFRDTRLARALNIPEVISTSSGFSEMDPLGAFGDLIPYGIITPLYYNTSSVDGKNYTSLDFTSNPKNYLRSRDTTLYWDNLKGIIDTNAITAVALTLDNSLHMDSTVIVPSESTGGDIEVPTALDLYTKIFNTFTVSKNIFDIQANHILYHENSVQSIDNENYPYVTYSIANNNSLSLMDTPWMNYMINSTKQKSRVQEDVLFGVQVSKFKDITGTYATDVFFTITYSETDNYPDNLGHNTYSSSDKYAYLWFCTLAYYKDTFEVIGSKSTKNLISKILIQTIVTDESLYSEDVKNNSSWAAFTNYSCGLLPFTYPKETASKCGTMSLLLDYNNIEDDIESQHLNKGYFAFSNYSIELLNKENYQNSPTPPLFTFIPTSTTRTIIYGIDRTSDTSNNKFYWSDPIYLLDANILEILNPSTTDNFYYPDWYNMGFQLNPYMNFTKNSANTLRHSTTLPRLIEPPINASEAGESPIDSSLLVGASENVKLTSLSRSHGMKYSYTDDNSVIITKGIRGNYLAKYPDFYALAGSESTIGYIDDITVTPVAEDISIWGDNRGLSDYDILDLQNNVSWKSGSIRSILYKDDNYIPCLSFKRELPYKSTVLCNNYYELDMSGSSTNNDYTSWWWNQRTKGFTVCSNLLFTHNLLPNSNLWCKFSFLNHNDIIVFTPLSFLSLNNSSVSSVFTVLNTPTLSYKWSTNDSVNYTDLSWSTESDEYSSTNNYLKVRIVEMIDEDMSNIEIGYYFISSFESSPGPSSNISALYMLGENNSYNEGVTVFNEPEIQSWSTVPRTAIESCTIMHQSNNFDISLVYEFNETSQESISLLQFNYYINGDESSKITLSNSIPLDYFSSNIRLSATLKVQEVNQTDASKWVTLSSIVNDKLLSSYYYVTTIDNNIVLAKYLDSNRTSQDTTFTPIVLTADTIDNVLNITAANSNKIDIGHKNRYKNFFGNLYDLRLYNSGVSSYNLYNLNLGLRRELYSYSPSIYKLGYSLYEDYGIMKNIVSPLNGITNGNINMIRIFTRSVWDSILADMYPISEEEININSPQYNETYNDDINDSDVYDSDGNLANGVIAQIITDRLEVTNSNNVITSDLSVVYGGSTYKVPVGKFVHIVNTTLYPIQYTDQLFNSGLKFKRLTDNTNEYIYGAYIGDENSDPAKIPAIPVGNTLTYRADLSPNFFISTSVNATASLTRGSNINYIYLDSTESAAATLVDPSIKSVNSNHLLFPLYIPTQPSTVYSFDLKGLTFSAAQLSSSITSLLDSTCYYNELRIPLAYRSSLSSGTSYVHKWDGIRNLKEGEYYITVKYPVQIIPILNSNINTSSNNFYGTVYLAFRFKIVVKGTPLVMTEEPPFNANKYNNYNYYNSISNTSSLYKPSDNRTFPHRIIDIKLYSMKPQSTSNYSWELIASNNSADGCYLLDREAVSSSILLDTPIYGIFCKSFTAPFFIATDSATTPIPDNVAYHVDRYRSDQYADDYPEKLSVTSESDLDNLSILSGRSYQIIFDYSGNLTEYSYSNKYFNNDSTYISDDEISNYARLVNLIDSTKSTISDNYLDCTYNGILTKEGINGNSYLNLTSGFSVIPSTTVGNPDIFSSKEIVIGNLGDPYNKSSTKNYLLEAFPQYRNQIDNAAYFPYKSLEDDIIVKGGFLTEYSVVNLLFSANILRTITLPSEDIILKDLWSKLNNNIKSRISNLKSSSLGAFATISTVTPYFSEAISITESLSEETHDLLSYVATDINLPLATTSILINRNCIFSNNKITNQDFTNTNNWITNGTGIYVYDSTWDNSEGKDVYQLTCSAGETSVYLKYITGNISVTSLYEAAISVKRTDSTATVTAQIVYLDKDDNIVYSSTPETLTNYDATSNWCLWSHESTTLISAVTFKYIFTVTVGSLLINKAVIRTSGSTSHYLGFSDCLTTSTTISGSSKLKLNSHSIVLFRKFDSSYIFPIQFNCSIGEYSSAVNSLSASASASVIKKKIIYPNGSIIRDFINNNKLGSYSKDNSMNTLIAPWVRMITYNDSTGEIHFFGYSIQKDGFGVNLRKVNLVNITDIFKATDNTNRETVDFSDSDVSITFGTESDNSKGIILNTGENSFFDKWKTNLQIDVSTDPIGVTDEHFSLLANCRYPQSYKAKSSNPVVVTNIQLLSTADETLNLKQTRLYEIEYLPIIYDENTQHISFNFFFERD